MAYSQPAEQNGLAPPYSQLSRARPGAVSPYRDNSRPFSLEEALPYTPFTSVFPFESDILNNPTIGSGSVAPSLAGFVSREDYDALNKEAENPTQSRRLEGSLEYVQSLLKPEKITKFHFKTAPKATSPSRNSHSTTTEDLAPFAKMVYDHTSISFRYPSPDSQAPPRPNGQAPSPRISTKSPKQHKQDQPKVAKQHPVSTNAQAVANNRARIEIHLPTQRERNAAAASLHASPKPGNAITPSPSPAVPAQPLTISPADLMVRPPAPPTGPSFPRAASQSQPQPRPPQAAQAVSTSQNLTTMSELEKVPAKQEDKMPINPQPSKSPTPGSQKPAAITIELPSATFNREEFLKVPDSPGSPTNLSMKRKHRQQDFDGSRGDDLNQRERANVVFADLRRCLQDVFAAEDHVSSQSGASSHLIVLTPDQEPCMTSVAHDKAHKLLKRAIEVGCFGQAPSDDLHRIQNLSEPSLKQADTLDFKIDESWGETEVGLWVQQLPDIERGLKAARTSLRIMCGARDEKQLYSEDLIQLGLNLFRNVMEGIIVPMAELRSSGPSSGLFRHLLVHKKALGTLFVSSQRLFALMSDLLSSIDLSESVVHALEFLASSLIFVENAYTEKDSVIGVQKFDGLRLVAMNILSQIFLLNPPQREGILNEILTSLEKLPVGKQSARQFKLADGGSIQPVSALIMRLVQASAGKVDDEKDRSRHEMIRSLDEDDSGIKANGKTVPTANRYTIRTEDHAAAQHSTAIQELKGLAQGLYDGAQRYAYYVVNFIVQRALKSTKSGDTPYRNLLDLFVEDFTTCLDSPDWPAAELLLRLLMSLMLHQSDGEKNSAPARNMALELLGVMAAAISRLRSHVRKIANNSEGTDADELGRWLADLSLMVLDGYVSTEKTLRWEGPYRIVLEFLQDRLSDDEHLRSAISYLVTEWGSQIAPGYDVMQDEPEERLSEFGRTAFRLRNMIEDPNWLSREWRFKSVIASHAKLSHSIILLRSQFCSAFKNILNILMGSMTTDQATVRSRSIKSINQVLETDPAILDGDSVVIDLILQCSCDTSPQVRDSALGLIGKCIAMRPRLEERMTPTVIHRFIDSGVGVRKRAMKLAKDIYLGNANKAVRSTIANGLLHRMQDPDEGVRELARQMIEEIWISPFYKDDDSVAFKQSLTDHVALMVQTSKQGNTALILDKVFQTILSPDSKLAEANTRVCTRLVANMFDLLDNPDSDDPSVPSGKDALQVLMIFAKAEPKLFTFEQIRLLQPHIASVITTEDLAVSRAVVIIYRRVLPQVSSVHSQFLLDIRTRLMPATAKITRTLLDDVFACIWIISGLLQNSEPVARLVVSSLAGIQKIRSVAGKEPLNQIQIRQLDRYSLIVGMAGKHCDLEKGHEDLFKSRFPKWQGSVSKLMIDVVIPFADPSRPVDVRRPALDAAGLICQSNPRNFVSSNVWKAFEKVFEERQPVLEAMILRSIKEFLFTEEQRSEQSSANAGKENTKKDLKVMGGTSFDDVASATTQRFLKDITRITLASQDDHAFLAMEVLASINRQGLVHPKETGVTLMTLETCPVTRISELAFREHKALHEKYESVLEREYAKAIQAAFQYQLDVIKDPRGATEGPFTAKLHLLVEVLKISKSKNRVKFLDKFIHQLDFEPTRLDVSQPTPPHLMYSRFLVENLAFFEYVTVGELQMTITSLEKLVTGTGSGLAQTIESEIFQVRMDPVPGSQQPLNGDAPPNAAPVAESLDLTRLRRFACGSMILLAVWEVRTYLRRLYGLSAHRRENKGKGTSKDLTKPPVRAQGITGDKLWEDIEFIMSALESRERMVEQCRTFVDLLNVDSEVKITEEDDDLDADEDPKTPEAEEDDEDATPDGRGRKRKAANSSGGRKKRARSNSRPRPRGRPRKQSTETMDISMQDADGWL